MRTRMISAAAAAVFLCGVGACQPGGAGGAVESQADYLARCVEETVAANAQAAEWADSVCAENWAMVEAAGPMAEAILAAEPATPTPVDPATLSGALTMVQWDAKAEGTLVASGRIGEALSVQVETAPSLNFYWDDVGAPIPYNVIDALKVRGASVSMVGCLSYGIGESNKAFVVEAAGHPPFMLSVYDRMAPTANANSFYNVSADLSGQVKTRAELSSHGDEWVEACPY